MNVCSFPSYLAVVEAEEKEIFSKRLMQHKSFWNEMTQHLEDLPERETSYSLKATRMTFQLDKSMSGKIKEFTLRHSISLNTFIIGIYILYVLKTTKKKYVTLGLPLLGRSSRTERETCGHLQTQCPSILKRRGTLTCSPCFLICRSGCGSAVSIKSTHIIGYCVTCRRSGIQLIPCFGFASIPTTRPYAEGLAGCRL